MTFSMVAAAFHVPTSCASRSGFSASSTLFPVVLGAAVLVGVTWSLTVVLVCFPLMISDVERLFMCLLAIFWGNVYSSPLSTF